MVRANEKHVIHHESMKRFGLRPNGEAARRIGDTVTSADMVVYEAQNSAIAFFMSFKLFMVKHILGSGRRPGRALLVHESCP